MNEITNRFLLCYQSSPASSGKRSLMLVLTSDSRQEKGQVFIFNSMQSLFVMKHGVAAINGFFQNLIIYRQRLTRKSEKEG